MQYCYLRELEDIRLKKHDLPYNWIEGVDGEQLQEKGEIKSDSTPKKFCSTKFIVTVDSNSVKKSFFTNFVSI